MQSEWHTMIYVDHACIILFKCVHTQCNCPKGLMGAGWGSTFLLAHGSGPIYSGNLDATKHVCCPTLQVMPRRTVLSTMAIAFATTTVL